MILAKRLLSIPLTFLKHLRLGFLDYFYFPFDHNQPLPKTSLRSCYLPVINFLNKTDIQYFVTDGSLLGLFRDSCLIPHDNDFDIALNDHDSIFKIGMYCITHGWIPGRVLFSLKTFRFVQVIFFKNKSILDFCIWTKNHDHMQLSVPEVRGLRSQPSYYYSHCYFYNVEDIKFKTHPDPQSWLELHYGSTWDIPKHYKGDWREDTSDIVENYKK